MFWKEGNQTFFHKGTNGRWRDILSADELRLYDKAMGNLPPDCAGWLEHGAKCNSLRTSENPATAYALP
jgi:aryl sulfotransferase